MYVEFESRCACCQTIAHNDAKKAMSLYCSNPTIYVLLCQFSITISQYTNKNHDKTRRIGIIFIFEGTNILYNLGLLRNNKGDFELYIVLLVILITNQICNSTSFKRYLISQSVKHHQKNGKSIWPKKFALWSEI